jgi:hypothetical protein
MTWGSDYELQRAIQEPGTKWGSDNRVNRGISAPPADYETERRQKCISRSQPLRWSKLWDWFFVLLWRGEKAKGSLD